MILSESAARRLEFVASAEAAGWDALPCDSVGEALLMHRRWSTRLALIDLGEMQGVSKAAYLKFAVQITSKDRLLIVADEPTRFDEEIAAWHSGAWFFLANPEFGPGLVGLFGEALRISEKASRTPSSAELQASDRLAARKRAL